MQNLKEMFGSHVSQFILMTVVLLGDSQCSTENTAS